MYNFDVLKELQFWRDFLTQGKPRIVCLFGRQSLIIDNSLMSANITWPIVTGDVTTHMRATYEDDLFTVADLTEARHFGEFEDEPEEPETDEDEQDED